MLETVLAEKNIKVALMYNNCAPQGHKTSTQNIKGWAAASYFL